MQYNNYRSNDKLYGFSDDMVELKPNDTFNSLFSSKEAADTGRLYHNPLFKELNKCYKKIFDTGHDLGLTDGEIQMMIYLYSNGTPLHDIEKSRLDEIVVFMKVNTDKLLSFVNPELHAFLLRTNYYKKNKNIMEKKHRMARIARIIKSLFGQKQSKEKLIKFSDILSRQ